MSQMPIISGDILQACDLCYARKIKCDRRSPCSNCADGGAECLRLRRGRASKKRALPSDFSADQMVLDINQPPRLGYVTPSSHDHVQIASPAATTQSASDADDSNYHAIQAKNIIELELDDCRTITPERQGILKSALQLVSQIADDERHQTDVSKDDPFMDPAVSVPEAPPREMLFMLLRGPSELTRFQWPDHISHKTYERMATALLQGDVKPEQRLFHQYSVCVYVRAIIHLYHVSRTTDNMIMRNEISQTRASYAAAALRSLEQFNVLLRPDVYAVQCLLSGASLMQLLGRLNQCWVLTSYAAQQIISLNYHKMRTVQASTDEEQEVHNAVYWCYYLDRTLSSLFERPTSLPELQVSPTDLIPDESSSPYDALIRVLLDLAQVQGKLHELRTTIGTGGKNTMLETCRFLESRMQSIFPRLKLDRESLPRTVHYDWVAVDFCYYAILVEINRTRLKGAFSPLTHKLCLLHSQFSLRAFCFLLERRAEMQGFDDPCPSFLTWTLFIYPLSPFFVVFCNIVGTLDEGNYTLLRRITDVLSRFKQSSHLGRLLNLLQSLQRLCEPLFGDQPEDDLATKGTPAPIDTPAPIAPTDGLSADIAGVDQFGASLNENVALRDQLTDESEPASTADWMMWELFNSQIPSGWLNSDFDPFTA